MRTGEPPGDRNRQWLAKDDEDEEDIESNDDEEDSKEADADVEGRVPNEEFPNGPSPHSMLEEARAVPPPEAPLS
jgi:hypothetical protein